MRRLTKDSNITDDGIYVICKMEFGHWRIDRVVGDRNEGYRTTPLFPVSLVVEGHSLGITGNTLMELFLSADPAWVYQIDSPDEVNILVDNIVLRGSPDAYVTESFGKMFENDSFQTQ